MPNPYDSAVRALGPYAQGDALKNMTQQVMDAYEKENESRVLQEREERQRQHEKEMEQMRIDAMLARLGQQSPRSSYTESGPNHSTTWGKDGSFRHRVG